MIKLRDRVVILGGEHADRHGTVVRIGGQPSGDDHSSERLVDLYLALEPGMLRVALDGERGQTAAEGGQGGRAGVVFNIEPENVRLEDENA